MNHDFYPDAFLRDILTSVRTIAVVGASPRPHRQDAEDQAASDCAKAQDLRNLPRCAQRCHGLVGAYTADTEALFGLVVGSKDLSVRLVRAIRACHRSVPARPFRA